MQTISIYFESHGVRSAHEKVDLICPAVENLRNAHVHINMTCDYCTSRLNCFRYDSCLFFVLFLFRWSVFIALEYWTYMLIIAPARCCSAANAGSADRR